MHRTVVPFLDIKTPERVCNSCYDKLQSKTLSSIFQNNDIYTQQTHSIDYETTNSDGSASNSPSSKYFSNIHTFNYLCFSPLYRSKWI